MPAVVILREGDVPQDPENFVLIEPIPAPRGAPRYRITAEGVNEEGPVSFSDACDSLELAREWADELVRTWRSRPPVYMRDPLGRE